MTTPAPLDLKVLHRIIVEAGSAHTVEQQIAGLVEQVSEAMGVDVCSLYQAYEDQNLHLVANAGLAADAVGRVTLSVGEGLAGHIARTLLPLNLQNAADHPDFVHFPELGEEALRAYLGVPIIYLGKVIGIIVVQDRDERAFTPVEESFLIAIAAQLAGSLLRLPVAKPVGGRSTGRRVEGIKGAPGKAVGKISLVINHQTLRLVDEPMAGSMADELETLQRAIAATREELLGARSRFEHSVADDVLHLFDFYGLMLDGDLARDAEARVRAGQSAFAAVRTAVDTHVAAFEAIEDAYLRARGEDVQHLGDELLAAIRGLDAVDAVTASNVVLLGELVSITDIGQFRPEQLAGIVCLKGSALSHTAILANALGLPAVMGVGPVDHIKDGDRIIVDGDQGAIVLSPPRALRDQYRAAIRVERSLQRELLEHKDLPAVTTDGHRVKLLANTGLLADVRPGLERGAEGIGLYRSEIPFLTHDSIPTETEQFEIYRELLQTYYPLPVTMRTLDVGGDKQLPYLPIDEENPSLGWRGIRFALDNRAILATQLRAMVQADEGLGNLRIMLPMISQVEEVAAAAELLDAVLLDLAAGSTPVDRPPLGIMVEVPGVVALIPHLKPWLDFVSIGTNDLTQYLLAVDRGNVRVSSRYDSLHPGVLHALSDIVETCADSEIEVSLCGEMASDPIAVALLVGLGVRSLSMSSFSLPRIRALIRGLSRSRAEQLLAGAMQRNSPEAIREFVHQALVADGLADLLGAAQVAA